MEPIEIVKTIMKYEGLDFEEAVESYQTRKLLPNSAFCGPNKTFLAKDVAHSFVLLSIHGRKMVDEVRDSIHRRLIDEAKKLNVEHKGCWICKGEEFKETVDKAIDWYIGTVEFEEAKKLWIAGAIKKKGALRAQLGIKEGETIPKSILQQIVKTETGKKVSFKGKSITVTTQLKRRALLALRLGKMKKG